MPTRLVPVLIAVLATTACDFRPELSSDPSAWDPAKWTLSTDASPPSSEGGAADAGGGAPDCDAEPPFVPDLTLSSANGVSHLRGTPCLEGCHEANGSAQLAFAAAGTVYRSQGSHDPAQGGAVQGVGGISMPVDRCGNFYAVDSMLKILVRRSKPYVRNPTLHMMDKSLNLGVERPGNCNQANCHDFSGTNTLGIYF